MATISSAGVGSGLDINSLITQLMNVEKLPLTNLDTKEASYQAKLSAYGSLKGAVASLQSAAHALKSSSLFTTMAAKATDATIASASAVSTAVAGTYSVNITALAKAQSLATKTEFTSHTTDLSPIDGKIKIEVGEFDGASFTPDSAKSPITIDIVAGTSSLDDIRDQINAATTAVRASVVYVGKNSGGTDIYKLALTSKDTGEKGSLRVTTMDSNNVVLTGTTGLAQLSYDPTKSGVGNGNEYDVTTPAQDAQLTVDGIAINRSSNTVTDAIGGVTLNLLKESSTNITVAKDTAAVGSALQVFVKAYNDVNKLAHDLSAYDSGNKTASVLTGDSGLRSLQSALRQMVSYTTGSTTATVRNLSSVGVALQRDGSLAFDSTKLDAAITKSSSDVAALFSADTTTTKGVAVHMSTILDSMLAKDGLLSSRTDGIGRSITDIGKQRDALNLRLIQIEKRYRAQFSALDTLVSSMQRTSAYLTQQLANLPGASSSS